MLTSNKNEDSGFFSQDAIVNTVTKFNKFKERIEK